MKKYLLPIGLLFISVISFAQDTESRAYKTGYSIGRVVGVVLIVGLVVWGIMKLVKRSK